MPFSAIRCIISGDRTLFSPKGLTLGLLARAPLLEAAQPAPAAPEGPARGPGPICAEWSHIAVRCPASACLYRTHSGFARTSFCLPLQVRGFLQDSLLETVCKFHSGRRPAASALPGVALHRRITVDTAASGALIMALSLGLWPQSEFPNNRSELLRIVHPPQVV